MDYLFSTPYGTYKHKYRHYFIKDGLVYVISEHNNRFDLYGHYQPTYRYDAIKQKLYTVFIYQTAKIEYYLHNIIEDDFENIHIYITEHIFKKLDNDISIS